MNKMEHPGVRDLLRRWLLSKYQPEFMEREGLETLTTRELFQRIETIDPEEANRLVRETVVAFVGIPDKHRVEREQAKRDAKRAFGFDYAPTLEDGLPQWSKGFSAFLPRKNDSTAIHAKEVVEAWVRDIAPKPLLLLAGGPGTGKTHLLQAAGLGLHDLGLPVFYRTEAELLALWRKGFDDKTLADEVEYVVQFAPALLIDDLGVGLSTPWAVGTLDRLVDWRYEKGMRLMVTTNLTVEALGKVSPRLASRFFDRERSQAVAIAAGDYRPLLGNTSGDS